MRKLLVLLFLLIAVRVEAQTGLFLTAAGQTCTQRIKSPTQGRSFCLESGSNALQVWNGAAWVAVTIPPAAAAGTGTLRTDAGTISAGNVKLESYTIASLPTGATGNLAFVTNNCASGVYIRGAAGWFRNDKVIDAVACGVKADRIGNTDGASTNGKPTLTSAGSTFTAADDGKFCVVTGAGTGGADWTGTVISHTGTSLTLNSNSGATLGSLTFDCGTDNTTLTATALTAASGKTLFFPPGDYFYYTGMLNPGAGTQIRGAGITSTKLHYSRHAIDSSDDGSALFKVLSHDGVEFHDFEISGSMTTPSTVTAGSGDSAGYPILVYDSNNVWLDHVYIHNHWSNAAAAAGTAGPDETKGSDNFKVTNSRFSNCPLFPTSGLPYSGVVMFSGDKALVTNNILEGCNIDFEPNNTSNHILYALVENNTLTKVGTAYPSIGFNSHAGTQDTGNKWLNNWIIDGWMLVGSDHAVVQGNYIKSMPGVSTDTPALLLGTNDGTSSANMKVDRNTVDGSAFTVVANSGNGLVHATLATPGLEFTYNEVFGGVNSNGVGLDGGCTSCTIQGNRIHGNKYHGLFVGSTDALNTQIIDNFLWDNAQDGSGNYDNLRVGTWSVAGTSIGIARNTVLSSAAGSNGIFVGGTINSTLEDNNITASGATALVLGANTNLQRRRSGDTVNNFTEEISGKTPAQHWVAKIDNTYDLGDNSHAWKTGYINTLNSQAINSTNSSTALNAFNATTNNAASGSMFCGTNSDVGTCIFNVNNIADVRGRTLALSGPVVTAGTGAGLTVNDPGSVRTQWYKVTIGTAHCTAASVECDKTIGVLPAKGFFKRILADLTEVYACVPASCTTATLSGTLGYTAGGTELLASFDLDAATALFGDADAELGTVMNAAARVANGAMFAGVLGSWTTTKDLVFRIHSGTGDLGTGAATNLSQGSVTFYVEVEIAP